MDPIDIKQKAPEQTIDYSKIFKIVWSRWYWILGCIVISSLLAMGYLWYKAPTYSTTSSLKFDERKSEFTELLKGVSNSFDRTNKIQSESFVIQSREILINAISHLDYKISYYVKGRVRISDIYPEVPFPIEILEQDTLNFYRGMLHAERLEGNKLLISYKIGERNFEKTYSIGQTIEAPGLKFKIKSTTAKPGANYGFKFNTKDDYLGRVAGGLGVREAAKSSNIMQLSMIDKNPYFAMDVLNAIMQEYTSTDVKRRSASASQTIDFIDRQLSFLYNKVQQSGSAVVAYKQKNKILDLQSSTQVTVSKLTQSKAQLEALAFQDLSLRQLEQQILNNKDKIEVNYSLETTLGGELSSLVSRLNSLLVERERKSIKLLPEGETMKLLDKQIADEKSSILQSIKLLRERFNQNKAYLQNQVVLAEQDITKIPTAERTFAKLQAAYDINQKVFDYLSEKKLEAEISRAAVVGGASIVDKATGFSIIDPIPKKIYTNAIFAGLAVGILLIFLARFLNPYIYTKESVEQVTQTPIIGVIRKFPGQIDADNHQALSLHKPKSVFAESVRSVRTNLSFLASEKDSKVICITSEIAGEGKSFVSVNLSSTLALIDKKVILIGADLRRSKLHKTFGHDNKHGLSGYLANHFTLDQIISKTTLEGMDFIPSGPVPPNPSELLHSRKMEDLLSDLRTKYDYILLDTAPVGLVSDSIPLIRKADINLFVIRSGVSKNSSATIPDKLMGEFKLSNVVIILNAFDEDALHTNFYTSSYFGGSYSQRYYYSDYSGYASSGYYTDDEKKAWWKFWKKS